MTITKAIEHFKYKLNKHWTATPTDADAINTLMKFVEDKHNQQLEANELFAKVYILLYAQYLEKFKATIFDDIPQKELHKLLDKPLSSFIHSFVKHLNDSEQYALFNDLSIKTEHPSTKTTLTKEKELKALKTALKEENNKDRLFGKVWTFEVVEPNIRLQINKVINNYK